MALRMRSIISSLAVLGLSSALGTTAALSQTTEIKISHQWKANVDGA